jgi:hypothetical protein
LAVDVNKLKSMAPPKGMEFHMDNHSVEIYRGVDQVGSDGRVRPSNEWHGVRSLEEAIANPVPGQDTHLPR